MSSNDLNIKSVICLIYVSAVLIMTLFTLEQRR